MSVAIGCRAVLALALLLACGCAGDPGFTDAIGDIPSPAGPESRVPNLATGADGELYLSWIEPDGETGEALRFATLEGKRWSDPLTIATGDDWFVNWADFPSMTALADGTLAAHWLVKSGEATYAYDVHVAISRDHGRTWSESLVPHRDGTRTEHGFVSLVPRSDGFLAVWLDGRETVGADGDHGGSGPGAMTLRSALIDPEGYVGAETVIDDRVCDCCQTDAVLTERGTTVVVYRDRSSSEVRDIYTARLESEAWSRPEAVYDDNWIMPACPVNGPAVASSGPGLACAWFTLGGQQHKLVQVAFSDDDGQSFGDPVRVDEGEGSGRVDVVLLEDGSAVVSWLERSEVRVRRATPAGTQGPTLVVAATSEARASGFPRLARKGNRVIVAWTQPGEPSRVRTAQLF